MYVEYGSFYYAKWMFFNLNKILLSIEFHARHRCCIKRQKLWNIFNPTSLFLNLIYKKNHKMIWTRSFNWKNNKIIIFWDFLRANTFNNCYTIATLKILRLLEKNEKFTILMLIFSHEAVKYQNVSLYIMKGPCFAFPKNTIAFTYDS